MSGSWWSGPALESLPCPPPRTVQQIRAEQRQAAGTPDLSWLDELLYGIDKDESEGGWWPTSTGVAFGTDLLTELKREIVRRYHSTIAEES